MTPEGRMDPLQGGLDIERLAQRIEDYILADDDPEVGGWGHAGITAILRKTLLASPVPSPSAGKCEVCGATTASVNRVRCPKHYQATGDWLDPAPSTDARAKLEQALRKILDLDFLTDAQGDRQPIFIRWNLALEVAREALLALPPHEGETPQRMECPTCHDDDCRVVDGECYNCRQRRGETPQPTTEPSGWRDIAERLATQIEAMTFDSNGGWEYDRAQVANLIEAAIRPLPPVVQTRPEDFDM